MRKTVKKPVVTHSQVGNRKYTSIKRTAGNKSISIRIRTK